jgi:hypothetical protein
LVVRADRVTHTSTYVYVTLVCERDGCERSARCPVTYADGVRQSTATLSRDGWYFSATTGWRCPDHAPTGDGAKAAR